MVPKNLWLASILASAALMATPCQAAGPWLTDLEQAKAQAAAEGKDLLLEFTGSDWCPPCIELEEKVFSQKVFLEAASKAFVLVKLDNPRDSSKQTDEERAQYACLEKRYAVTGVPTVILADAKGKPYHRGVGYSGAAAKDYVGQLMTLPSVRVERDAQLAAAAKSEGLEKARHLDRAIAGIEPAIALVEYLDIIELIVKLDAANEAGLKRRYQDTLMAFQTRAALDELTKAGSQLSPGDRIKRVDRLIEQQKLKGEPLQQALFYQANCLFHSEQKSAAKARLLEARAAAPESPIGQRISTILARAFVGVPLPEGFVDPTPAPSSRPSSRPRSRPAHRPTPKSP